MSDQTFSHLLRQYLDGRKLGVTTAALLWHVDPDTLHKILRGAVSVPRTKIGFWSQVLELPEDIVRAAVNATRLSLGRDGLPSSTPSASGQDGAAPDARAEAHDDQHAAQDVA